MAGVYGALADLVVGLHFVYLAVLVFGGWAAWRWRRRWLLAAHLALVAWAAGAVTFRYDCPLTSLEGSLRAGAGQAPAADGFLRHYVRGALFPEWLTPYVVAAGAAIVLTGWVRLAWPGGARTPASGCPSPTRTAGGSAPSSRSRTSRTGSSPRP